MEAHGVMLAEPRVARRSLTAVAVRALDLCLAVVVLVLALPLMLAIALAIRLDSRGPAVFRQRRVGRHGRSFTVNKFRTMITACDEAIHRDYVRSLISGEGLPIEEGGRPLYKLAVDDRVTRVGAFLRRWSLDELPQLVNVIRGEMSLVGPRPAIEYEVEHYPGWYHGRFAVKPGMTGLWQVNGRNETDFEDMIRFDLDFVRRYGLGLYMAILARTVWVVVLRRGAA